jgi:ABC-type transporter Mla MlaB component
MPSLLKNLELEELSLVDKPANPLAMAPLFKRDNSNGETMTKDIKKTEETPVEIDTTEVDTLKAEIETLKAANEALRKSFLDEGYKITAEGVTKAAEPDYITVDGEQINKADVPAPILKRMETAEAELKAQEITKKAKETLPNFKEDVAVKLMKFDLDDDIMQILSAADALFAEVMTEKGETNPTDDFMEPSDKLKELAKAFQTENKTTYEKAYTEVVKTAEGKALANEIMKGKK